MRARGVGGLQEGKTGALCGGQAWQSVQGWAEGSATSRPKHRGRLVTQLPGRQPGLPGALYFSNSSSTTFSRAALLLNGGSASMTGWLSVFSRICCLQHGWQASAGPRLRGQRWAAVWWAPAGLRLSQSIWLVSVSEPRIGEALQEGGSVSALQGVVQQSLCHLPIIEDTVLEGGHHLRRQASRGQDVSIPVPRRRNGAATRHRLMALKAAGRQRSAVKAGLPSQITSMLSLRWLSACVPTCRVRLAPSTSMPSGPPPSAPTTCAAPAAAQSGGPPTLPWHPFKQKSRSSPRALTQDLAANPSSWASNAPMGTKTWVCLLLHSLPLIGACLCPAPPH